MNKNKNIKVGDIVKIKELGNARGRVGRMLCKYFIEFEDDMFIDCWYELEDLEIANDVSLSYEEKIVLRNINKDFTKIRRNEGSGNLQATNNEMYACLCAYNHLFKFIKERRRI